jgi:hypothetical protein
MMIMSDEETPAPAEEEVAEEEVSDAPAINEEASEATKGSDVLRKKFRLTADEEILKDIKPSAFAFISLYVVGALMFLTHFIFGDIAEILLNPSDDSNFFYELMIDLIGITGVFGFVLVMFLLTWFNRMMNGSTSGGWVTSYLLIWTFLPVVLWLDDTIIAWIFGEADGYLPGFESYPFTLIGIISSSLFIVLVVVYQRSFHYAITNHRVIFTQHLIIPGDGRRILFDNINEVRTQRTLMGGILGYNTILCDTGSQLNIGEESMGVSAGAAPSSGGGDGMLETQMTKSFFVKTFAFLTYQRTRKVELPDPRYCFFSISKWKDIEQLLNVMHQRHSQSGILTELKEQIAGED